MSPKRSNSTSSKRRAASALSTRTPQNSSFQEFLNRQDKSFNNQHSMATSNYEPTPKRFIDRKSEQLAKNPIHLKNRKPKPPPEEVEEYTFKPDTSLTRNYRTKNSLSCSCVEAHSIVHEIKMKGLKLDIDENDSQKYKFAPEMELTKGMREYAKRNEAAILAAKEKKKKEKIEEIIREEDTEMEKQIHAHKVPERTQKIGYYMNLFKEDD
ncbi:uncharacterized protein GO595_005318 [Histomonas meleagridis]|uniref:uncharacterized protein n=1 Tax=Histomonas meleagridis TaxID=135588 RepID=UPI00355A254E|nr:hypothetical protein GO595_005318 [Histomonas meleagridis]